MRANVMENLLKALVKAGKESKTEVRENNTNQLLVKAEILLDRKSDASVIREFSNGNHGG